MKTVGRRTGRQKERHKPRAVQLIMYTRLNGRLARFRVHKEIERTRRREAREAEVGVAFMHRAFLDALIISRIILRYHAINISESKEVGSQRRLVNAVNMEPVCLPTSLT